MNDREKQASEARLGATTNMGGPVQAQGQARYADCGSPSRPPSIRERIDWTLRDAERVYQRAYAAQRAKAIIDAHPEFAELLDALSEF